MHAGDRVALVAPASALEPDEIELALENVRALGFEPVLGKHAPARSGSLAGSDRDRIFDFNAALNDDTIHALFALRGGYGTMRIAHAIDYAAFERTPKVVMGYSDMTVVLNALTSRAGAITYHGPVMAAPLSEATRHRILRTLTEYAPFEGIEARSTLRTGIATGQLCGGNLSLLASTCGTPFAVDCNEALVMIEDVGEADYRVDRLLTQLILAGAFERASGFIIGDVPNIDIVRERLAHFKKPTVAGVPFGHIDEQWILPIGADATLDASEGYAAKLKI